jgi:hypothetical protein
MTKSDNYWNILNSIDDSIKFADAKAIALLSIYSILITILFTGSGVITSFTELNVLEIIVLVFSCLSFIISTYYAFRCLRPSFIYKSKESILFFSSISNQFESAEKYYESSYKILSDDKKLFEQLSEQVFTKSKIASGKYKQVKISFNFFIIFIIFLIISIILVSLKSVY